MALAEHNIGRTMKSTLGGKCDECASPFQNGDSIRQVGFATLSTGFIAECCFDSFPVWLPFEEGSGVWIKEETH
jgi:hypothetical protein